MNKLSLVLSHANKYLVTLAKLLLVNIFQSLKASVTTCFPIKWCFWFLCKTYEPWELFKEGENQFRVLCQDKQISAC